MESKQENAHNQAVRLFRTFVLDHPGVVLMLGLDNETTQKEAHWDDESADPDASSNLGALRRPSRKRRACHQTDDDDDGDETDALLLTAVRLAHKLGMENTRVKRQQKLCDDLDDRYNQEGRRIMEQQNRMDELGKYHADVIRRPRTIHSQCSSNQNNNNISNNNIDLLEEDLEFRHRAEIIMAKMMHSTSLETSTPSEKQSTLFVETKDFELFGIFLLAVHDMLIGLDDKLYSDDEADVLKGAPYHIDRHSKSPPYPTATDSAEEKVKDILILATARMSHKLRVEQRTVLRLQTLCNDLEARCHQQSEESKMKESLLVDMMDQTKRHTGESQPLDNGPDTNKERDKEVAKERNLVNGLGTGLPADVLSVVHSEKVQPATEESLLPIDAVRLQHPEPVQPIGPALPENPDDKPRFVPGIVGDQHHKWNEMFRCLQRHYCQHGSFDIGRVKRPDDTIQTRQERKKLYSWVIANRLRYWNAKAGILTPTDKKCEAVRSSKLGEINFDWGRSHTSWYKLFRKAVEATTSGRSAVVPDDTTQKWLDAQVEAHGKRLGRPGSKIFPDFRRVLLQQAGFLPVPDNALPPSSAEPQSDVRPS